MIIYIENILTNYHIINIYIIDIISYLHKELQEWYLIFYIKYNKNMMKTLYIYI